MLESEEITFNAAFGNETVKCRLWRQVDGSYFHVYINDRVAGGIYHYDGGWMVCLNGTEFNQGDADELLTIAGISLADKYPAAGFVERQGATIIKDAYKKAWTDRPIDYNEKSPD
jgi:hypothetical protein